MKVVRLSITNFRGIKSAVLHFDGHTLMVGANNVGKSTICEALDLVLGPDRLNRFPPIDEFDFYNAEYLEPQVEGEVERKPVELRIEAVVIELSEQASIRCHGHSEFWHTVEMRLLGEGEAALADLPDVLPCLRVETVGIYDAAEDEFAAKTWFSHSPDEEEGKLTRLPKDVKRMFGFLYLRALRTGSRALSLERGSLLDIILRTKGARAMLWEKSIDRLRHLDIESDATALAPILRSIEKRLARYIAMEAPGNATKLHVSDLTREHLRKTMSFFLSLSVDQGPVPFAHAGTGTLNTLVLALLSFIADLKPEGVIFAMEEPEIAVPPPTQRRIAQYLLTKTTQAFVTSHSPFVIERFEPSHTLLLSRDLGVVSAQRVSDASGLTDKEFKTFARTGLCECMLGKAAIVVEGVTEFHALPVAARRMEEQFPHFQPLDISGSTFFNAFGESNMPKFGKFFKTLGLKTFGFYDTVPNRSAAQKASFAASFDVNYEHAHRGFEDLVSQEMPVARLWTFLEVLRDGGDAVKLGIPAVKPDDVKIREHARIALMNAKGAGWAASLFEDCGYDELPPTVTGFLGQAFAALPALPEAVDDDTPPGDGPLAMLTAEEVFGVAPLPPGGVALPGAVVPTPNQAPPPLSIVPPPPPPIALPPL